ncbi:MAG: hypothetical protein JW850_14650 [Thermoflexales bacterium]|nr:hypothetical protein [Thermoflexales bacterium]
MSTKISELVLTRRQFLAGTSTVLAGLLLPTRWLPGSLPKQMQAAPTIKKASIAARGPIIADHTIVDQYIHIPQHYIDIVKTMWVQALGLSHSGAYRCGVNLVAAANPNFPGEGRSYPDTPPPPTDTKLRVTRHWWYDDPLTSDGIAWNRAGVGEEHFWTTRWAIENVKTNITYCNGAGANPVHALCFAWCWDMVSGTGGTIDPVYGCRWGGQSRYWNGTSFADAGRWGLDDGDTVLIDPGGAKPNLVNMQDYIDAVREIDAHDPNTLCFFTTGPVDDSTGISNEGESGYQRHLKHEYLRNYVRTNGGVLLDYADILAYNDAGVLQTTTWDGHPVEPKAFPLIHPDNDGEYYDSLNSGSCHIGEAGCLRLGKAMWWMLARAAGWDGVSGSYHVSQADGNWHTAGTWDSGALPGANDAATIAAGTTVTLDADAQCYRLVIEAGATLVIPEGVTLTVVDTIINQGVLRQTRTVNNGRVVFLEIGDGRGTIRYRGVELDTANDLGQVTVSVQAGADLSRNVEITAERDAAARICLWAFTDELSDNITTPRVYRYVAPGWVKLANPSDGALGLYTYAEADTPGFSHFLIADDTGTPTAVGLRGLNVRSGQSSVWALVGLVSAAGAALAARKRLDK